MMILFWLLMVVFIIICILLCFFVLIQSDKGGGISGAIGGGLGGAQSLLGTQDTANFLTRATVGLSAAFLVMCIVLSVIVSHQDVKSDKSLLQKRAEKQQDYSPASVLSGQQGLPIKEGDGSVSPGLPGAAPEQQPAGELQGMPSGAIPIGTPEQKKEEKK
jgi:preprotein translocase subunit SecG